MEPNKEEKKKISFSTAVEMTGNSARVVKLFWKEEKTALIVLFVLSLLMSGVALAQSGARGLLVNKMVSMIGRPVIDWGLIIFVALFVLSGVLPPVVYKLFSHFDKIFWLSMGEKLEYLFLKKRSDLDVAVHEDPKQKDLLNKTMENGAWRAQSFVSRQYQILGSLLEVLISAAAIGIFRWWVFVIVFIGAIPELIVEMKYGQEVWNIYSGHNAELKRRFWDLRGYFDNLPSLIELRLFQNTAHFLKLIKELFHSFMELEIGNIKSKLLYRLVSVGVSQLTIAMATVWLIIGALKGEMQIGTLTFVIASIYGLRNALSGMFSALASQYQDNLFVSDMFKFLDLKPVIRKEESVLGLPKKETPEIVFDNVTFNYPKTSKTVLKNFSLTIKPGEKIALVGINGAGKTTFVKLLCRFYDPDKGMIRIGGNDLKKVDLDDWYDKIGAIFQDYSQYHFAVRDAIAIGRVGDDSPIEKVQAAAKAAEADTFIEEWEKSYDQMLGKQFTEGIEPSIGQWQKLALARAFYRDPRVLILDEPTSSIDAEAEANIFEKIRNLPKDRTVIFISHRFSTVRQANRIAVVEDGTVKELGTHEELLKLDGTYAKLFRLQAKGYE